MPPTVWVPKSMLAGVRLTRGAGTGTPVPARLIVAGPLLASDWMVSDALRAPSAAGAKLTLIVHCALIASGVAVLQVPARWKSAELAPASVKALKFSARLPLLRTVTD